MDEDEPVHETPSSEPPPPEEAAPAPAEAPPAPADTRPTGEIPPVPGGIPPTPVEGPPPAAGRPKNGLGAASLVLGVASLVAVASFVLFPLGLIGGIVGVVIGIIALLRTEGGRSTNRGQSIAGLTCSGIALILAVVLAVRVGTWVSDNRTPLRRLETCLTKADQKSEVGDCFSRFAVEISR